MVLLRLPSKQVVAGSSPVSRSTDKIKGRAAKMSVDTL